MPVSEALRSLLPLRNRAIKIGRRYRGQAFALIALCRDLVENDTNPRDDGLQTILQLADNALLAAEGAKNETSAANDAFKDIRTKLGGFPKAPSSQKLFKDFTDASPKDEDVVKRIKRAEEKSSPTPKAGPSTKVTFVLRKSLHEDRTQIIFQKKLENTTTIPEVLWILRHEKDDKKFTWKQNPHFYSELPKEAPHFGPKFHHKPLKDFCRALGEDSVPIYILRDKSCRLHLDDANPRVFGNVWHPYHTVILKDICGTLDSEHNVHPPKEFDFLYRHASQQRGSSSDSVHPDVLHRMREESSWDWPRVLQAALDCRDIDLMVRVKGKEDVPGWNPLPPPEASPPRSERQISSAPGAPASTPTSSRPNNVPVDGSVYPSQDPANIRRDAENGQHHVHPIDSTRDGRPSASQSRTSRKPQGSDSQSSLSSGAQKPGEPPSQRERPITAGGFPAHSTSQTSSPPKPPASTHTSPARLDDGLVYVPAKVPQDRPIVREEVARGQRHVHAINSTQSRELSGPQGSGHQSLSSEVQKPGEHSPQREITARPSPASFASQTSSSPSAPASTPTSSRLDDVPVNIRQDRPIVREDAVRGQRHVHASNTREGRPSDSQNPMSSYPQGSDIQSPLSSGAQKPGERFQEKHATTPGKSTTRYAGQNSSPPNVLAIMPVDSSTTSINMTFNITQPTVVIPTATPQPSLTPAQKPTPPPPPKGWFQTIRNRMGW